jgi:hypothetical protein
LVKIACRDPDLISRKGREVREGAGGDFNGRMMVAETLVAELWETRLPLQNAGRFIEN